MRSESVNHLLSHITGKKYDSNYRGENTKCIRFQGEYNSNFILVLHKILHCYCRQSTNDMYIRTHT